MPAIIAEIEEIVEFDDLIARAMADIDDVNMLNDGQDPRERQSIDINNFCLFSCFECLDGFDQFVCHPT